MSKLILASKSPRRFELLSMTGRGFDVMDAHVDEESIVSEILASHIQHPDSDLPPMYHTAEHICLSLASAKAQAVLDQHDLKDILVLGSDTVVVTDDEILGKPKDEADARRMLTMLSGRTHRVYTGVALLSQHHRQVFSAFADVKFNPLDEIQQNLIERYIATGSPMDKAGAYGIQDEGALLIDSINGDYYAVVGLPVSSVNRALETLN